MLFALVGFVYIFPLFLTYSEGPACLLLLVGKPLQLLKSTCLVKIKRSMRNKFNGWPFTFRGIVDIKFDFIPHVLLVLAEYVIRLIVCLLNYSINTLLNTLSAYKAQYNDINL